MNLEENNNFKAPPEQIIIRPPVEAYSILIPVTGGCSWNRCEFCGVYKQIQDYSIIPIERVKKYIDYYASRYPDHDTVFLAGGNPTSAPTDYLAEIISYVRNKFRNIRRISCYSKALDIINKDDYELKLLADSGLSIVYMGLESGSDTILKKMKKGTTSKTFIKVGKRILNAGIKLSLYIILGLGSYELSDEHVRETARVLTEINPTIFRFRTLNVMKNSPLFSKVQSGEFKIMKPVDIIREERDIIENLGPNVTSEVYNDHISNYLSFSSKNISKDRTRIIKEINRLLNDPAIQNLKPKYLEHM